MKSHCALIFLLACLSVQSSGAATIIVTSTADNGAGTLRQALATPADGDIIDATGVSGTILLTSGELVVSKSVTVLGPGYANLSVDGNAADRVFIFQSNLGSISGLSIVRGGGGGIWNDATLTVSNCITSGNSVLNVYGDNFAGGRGVFNAGSAEIINSTISDDQVQ